MNVKQLINEYILGDVTPIILKLWERLPELTNISEDDLLNITHAYRGCEEIEAKQWLIVSNRLSELLENGGQIVNLFQQHWIWGRTADNNLLQDETLNRIVKLYSIE